DALPILSPSNCISQSAKNRSPFCNPHCSLPNGAALRRLFRRTELNLLARADLLLIFEFAFHLISLHGALLAGDGVLCQLDFLLFRKERARRIRRSLRGTRRHL